jgi:hypothetical protein
MSLIERDEFLASTMDRHQAAEIALHDGDPLPRHATWSANDR